MKTCSVWIAEYINMGWVISRQVKDEDAHTISREIYGGTDNGGVPREIYANFDQANETAGWLNGTREYRPAASVRTKQRRTTPRGPAGELASDRKDSLDCFGVPVSAHRDATTGRAAS